MFNVSNMIKCTITFDSWYTERKLLNDGRELQADNESAHQFNSPKRLIPLFQPKGRTGTPDKANNPAVFDTNHVTKYFVETDGARYSRDGIMTNFEENSFLDQYRDLKISHKEYVGEEFLLP